MSKKHNSSLDDIDWEGFAFHIDYDARMRRYQEIVNERAGKQKFEEDCFPGHSITYCNLYGSQRCNRKCDYALQQKVDEFWKNEQELKDEAGRN